MSIQIKRFLTLSNFSQLLNNLNPLSELTHKRKITLISEKISNKKQTTLKLREINISQYGRICPIETTEGKNSGLILYLSKETNRNKLGFITTPLFT